VPRQDDVEDQGFGEASRYTAHLDRGWSLLDRGDLRHARNSALQALKIRPEVPDGAMLMAAICLAEADPDGSLDWYERAIEADPEYVEAQLAAAQLLLYDLDEPQRALTRAEIARELDEATLADQLDLGILEVEAMVGLGDYVGARDRLAALSELWVLEQMLSPDTERDDLRHALEQFVGQQQVDLDEDWEHVVQRAVQLGVRVARAHMDLGAPESAMPWLDRLLRSFGDDADIWYLANEAAYLAGDSVKAAQAALQVLQLDAAVFDNPPTASDGAAASGEPISGSAVDWAPSPSELHAKIVELLLNCPDPQLAALAREPGFVVLVNEAPAFELVLEGIDPRVRAIALAARSIRELEAAPTLTGLALYRRNLVRLARDRQQFDRELAQALFDELAMFFGFDDVRRNRLGLAPSDWGPAPQDPRGGRPKFAHSGAATPGESPAPNEHEREDGRRKPSKRRTPAVESAAPPMSSSGSSEAPSKPSKPRKPKAAASKKKPTVSKKPAVGKKPAAVSKKPATVGKKSKPERETKRKTSKAKSSKAGKPIGAKKAAAKPARKRASDEPLDD
jgi:tetratricopeptide (TPR) repeat protein